MRLSLILAALLAACGTTENRKPPPARTQQDNARIAQAIEQGRVLYAMTKSEVTRSAGKPLRKRSETFYGRPRQRWDYNSYSVYFDNDGFVVRIEGAGH